MTAPHPEAALSAQKIDHEFKSRPDVFWAAARGEKQFEFRKDDRGGYHVGQIVRLCCYDPDYGFCGHPPLDRRITNILRGGEFGLQDGYCILGLAPLSTAHTATAGDGGEHEPMTSTDAVRLWEIEQAALTQGPAVQAPAGVVLAEMTDEAALRNAFAEGVDWARKNPTPTDAQPKSARPVGDEALREALAKAALRGLEIGAPGWLDAMGDRILAALASHPTTGQETVATPRDGGVREALDGLHGAIGRLEPTDGLEIPAFSTPDELASALGLGEGLAAPGRAGPGEPTDDVLEAACVAFLDGDPAEWRAWKSCQTMPRITRFREQMRQALRAATPSPAQEPGTGDTGALADIAAERRRQVEAEGWTPEHDDMHDEGELADAAACYATGAIPLARVAPGSSRFVPLWPWLASWWKPGDRRRNLVKSGALIVAEIERLDRASPPPPAIGNLEGEGRS